MGRRRLCLMAWTIAAGIVTGALSGADSQCGANSRPTYLVVNQNKTLSFTAQSLANCWWIISSNSINTRLRLTAAIFNVRSLDRGCVDSFTVYDGNSSYAPILLSTCSRADFPIYSSGSDVLVSFTTGGDFPGQTSNFVINIEVFNGVCLHQGAATSVTHYTEYLEYPSSAINYANNVYCSWLLQTSSYYYLVRVTFTFVDIETSGDCCYDYVELLDGSSPSARSLGRVCNLTSRDFYSSGQSMYITFHSNSVTTGRGFKLTYQAVSGSNVDTTADSSCSLHPSTQTASSDTEGYLQYSTNSSSYPNNFDCGWVLKAANTDYVVHVTFTFVDIEYSSNCEENYVDVVDGPYEDASTMGRLCGSTVQDFYSSWDYMSIKFHSDHNITGGGFRLTYKAVGTWEVPGYRGSTTPAIVGGAIGGSIIFVAAVFVVIVSVRRCRQSARNRPTNTNNNQNIVYFHPTNGSAPQAGPPSVIGGPPSVSAVPPSNISSPPSYTADPPSYEVVTQGTSYPNTGVHTMNHPLPQGSQYPTTRQLHSAGTQVTGGQVNQSFSL